MKNYLLLAIFNLVYFDFNRSEITITNIVISVLMTLFVGTLLAIEDYKENKSKKLLDK